VSEAPSGACLFYPTLYEVAIFRATASVRRAPNQTRCQPLAKFLLSALWQPFPVRGARITSHPYESNRGEGDCRWRRARPGADAIYVLRLYSRRQGLRQGHRPYQEDPRLTLFFPQSRTGTVGRSKRACLWRLPFFPIATGCRLPSLTTTRPNSPDGGGAGRRSNITAAPFFETAVLLRPAGAS